jgi:RNA polymerase sigma factor (sigma-70 family)
VRTGFSNSSTRCWRPACTAFAGASLRTVPEADDLSFRRPCLGCIARATYLTGANVPPWVFAIARSVHLDRLRYWRRRPENLSSTRDATEYGLLHADERYGPEAQALAHDLLEIVTSELSRMSEKNRLAYVLLREEGFSASDAASMLGTTADVVKQRAHRAYEQLRAAFRAAGWKERANDTSRDANPIEV